MKQKGFTLIELLVVVAVIGILASAVVVNFSGAQERARDSRVISAMGQIRPVAEIIYSKYNYSYANVCSGGTLNTIEGLQALKDDINSQKKPTAAISCVANSTKYCVSIELSKAGDYYCVTSEGKAGMASTACNTTSYTCTWTTQL
jgi:prepilin-type N-terminal cleavage/methylation domain-containing protein